MKRRFIYRPQALTDLNDAEAYTRRTWSERQAKPYIAVLVSDIKALCQSALRHPLCEQIVPGLRRRRNAMHQIYYLASVDRVEIVRIIHVQRDPGLHLRIETWDDADET